MSHATILVVDDHQPSRELVEAYLTPEGYRVVAAAGADEAMQRLAEDEPDLVLLDVVMPHTDGYSVCRSIKQSALGATTPVVMLTSLKERKDRVRSIEAGADDFLSKPVNRLELLTRIRSLVRIRVLHQNLEERNRRLAAFESGGDFLLQMMVHDLKNPLTVVETNLEMMEMKGLQDVGENLATSRHYCRILYHLIQDMSETAKLEAGALPLKAKPLDPADLVARCASEFRPLAELRGKSLLVSADDHGPITGDPHLLFRVVFNLMANGLGRARSGGTVRVTLSRTPEVCRLTVADDGPPIAPEHLGRVFDRYAHPDTDHRVGRGLSLAFCRLAVEAHGGSVGVASDAAGGAEFRVALPVSGRQ